MRIIGINQQTGQTDASTHKKKSLAQVIEVIGISVELH